MRETSDDGMTVERNEERGTRRVHVESQIDATTTKKKGSELTPRHPDASYELRRGKKRSRVKAGVKSALVSKRPGRRMRY